MNHHQLFCKSRSLLLNMFSSQPFVEKKRKNDTVFQGFMSVLNIHALNEAVPR